MAASPNSSDPLLAPVQIGSRLTANRIMFGPHETNLGDGRAFSARHVGYYRQRAIGGAGILVTETASVHPSDWPYERCPAAWEAASGWREIGAVCGAEGTLVVASLGHSGGQGSSAYHQRPLFAPSDEPEVNTREVPKIMEPEDISAVIEGFADSAKIAVDAGLAGVEVNAGQHSLARQFLSGLTNRREDRYGTDKLAFLREVLAAVRALLGPQPLLGLRLSCDELAPWAGITPEAAVASIPELAAAVDYLVVVRGGIFSVAETRPTLHHPPGFNLDLTGQVVKAAGPTPVFAQGSIVDLDQARLAVETGTCSGVEMTRAQIADPDLVAKLKTGNASQVRPCTLCNQLCQVRDNRNPILGCVVNPRAGHETTDHAVGSDRAVGLAPTPAAAKQPSVLVVGAGPAGLEAARVAAINGRSVRLVERGPLVGGMALVAARAPANSRLKLAVRWLEAECIRHGVTIDVAVELGPDDVAAFSGDVILATGSVPGLPSYQTDQAVTVDVAEMFAHPDFGVPAGSSVAVWDPVGGPIGVAAAELLADAGHTVHYLTPDAIAGNLLALSGDLAGSNVRLQQAGVTIHRRVKLRSFGNGRAELEHSFTAERFKIPVAALIDAGPRLPGTSLADALATTTAPQPIVVGDAVAPRSVAEAIREGRNAALLITNSTFTAGAAIAGAPTGGADR